MSANYAEHSEVTDPHGFGSYLGAQPPDVEMLSAIVGNLVIHRDRVSGLDINVARLEREPHLRYVEDMLDGITALDPSSLDAPRRPADKLIGHCRTEAVLLCAALRHRAIPARPRAGYAVYYAEGRDFYGDHWVTEVWDDRRQGWRLVDPELDEDTRSAHGIEFDPTDVPRSQFIVAGAAWQSGRADPTAWNWYGPQPDRTGQRQVAAQLLRDAANLLRDEPGAFDDWAPVDLPPPILEDLDLLAALTINDPDFGAISTFIQHSPELARPSDDM